MKKCFLIVIAVIQIANPTRADHDLSHSHAVSRFSAEALASAKLDAIVVVALSQDMHLRMGYHNPYHSARTVLEALRLLPVYVVETIYSKNPLPKFIFIFGNSHRSLVEKNY